MFTHFTFDCPHCNEYVSITIGVEDDLVCPYCTKIVTDEELKEQMDRYEDPSEHFDDFSDADPGL